MKQTVKMMMPRIKSQSILEYLLFTIIAALMIAAGTFGLNKGINKGLDDIKNDVQQDLSNVNYSGQVLVNLEEL